jgi:hypothetical protein
MFLIWTTPLTASEKEELTPLVSDLEGVTEVYSKSGDGYERVYRNPRLRGRELDWARTHNQALVNTLYNESSPQFVATMFDDTGYALEGAHGGTQEMLQRIPLIVVSPNLARKGAASQAWARLVDINPMIGELMGLTKRDTLDGTSDPVVPFVESSSEKIW